MLTPAGSEVTYALKAVCLWQRYRAVACGIIWDYLVQSRDIKPWQRGRIK